MLKRFIVATSICCITFSSMAIAEVHYYQNNGQPYQVLPKANGSSNSAINTPNYQNYPNGVVDPNFSYPYPNYNGEVVDPGFTHPMTQPPYPPYGYPPLPYPPNTYPPVYPPQVNPPMPPAPPQGQVPPPRPPRPPQAVTENNYYVYPSINANDLYPQGYGNGYSNNSTINNYGSHYGQQSYEIYTKEGRAELVRDYPQYRTAVTRIESFELRLQTEQDRLRNLRKTNSDKERIERQEQNVYEIRRQLNAEYASLERELQRYGLLRSRPY